MPHDAIPEPKATRVADLTARLAPPPRRRRPQTPAASADTAAAPQTPDAPAAPQPPAGPEGPADSDPIPATRDSTSTTPRSRRRHTPAQPATPAAPVKARPRKVTMSLPATLDKKLGEYARSQHLTRAAVILHAVTQTRQQLPAKFAPEEPEPGQLFVGIPNKRVDHPLLVASQALITAQDLHALDELWRAAGASGRSAYVRAALETWFDTGTE